MNLWALNYMLNGVIMAAGCGLIIVIVVFVIGTIRGLKRPSEDRK